MTTVVELTDSNTFRFGDCLGTVCPADGCTHTVCVVAMLGGWTCPECGVDVEIYYEATIE